MIQTDKGTSKRSPKYNEPEKRKLREFFREFKHDAENILKERWLSRALLDPSIFPKFCELVPERLSQHTSEERYKSLFTPGRLTDEQNLPFVKEIYDEIIKGILSSSSGNSSSPSSSSSSSSSEPPGIPLELPGIPLEPEYAVQAENELDLPPKDAKKAVRPVNPKGGTISVTGYPRPLYHDTEHATFTTSAVNPSDKPVITYFYIKESDRYYLVAWGHHVAGSEYKIDRQVPQIPVPIKGLTVTFT